jgi:hypothetical protein
LARILKTNKSTPSYTLSHITEPVRSFHSQTLGKSAILHPRHFKPIKITFYILPLAEDRAQIYKADRKRENWLRLEQSFTPQIEI